MSALVHRPDTLDPALLRPGRLDRRIEFSLPDNEGRAHILRIHGRSMSVERNIRYELIARLCPNSTGAELRSVCTEAGMFAIRARRKVASEKDFLDAVDKVRCLLFVLGFEPSSRAFTLERSSDRAASSQVRPCTRSTISECHALTSKHCIYEILALRALPSNATPLFQKLYYTTTLDCPVPIHLFH